jgi:plastocyanin
MNKVVAKCVYGAAASVLVAGCFAGNNLAPAGGSLSGTVRLEGAAPKRAPINMAKEPICAQMHASVPVMTEEVLVDAAGNLQNVVVYVSAGLQETDPVPPQDPVVITQEGCSYKPHVIAMQARQKIRIVNGDKTSHNIHPMPETNREWNKSQPPGSAPFEEVFAREEVGIPVKCNVHPWMRAYISVFRHSHFSVTNQTGTFSLKNLPPGTYTVTAWHEKLGKLSQQVTVGADDKNVQFVFKTRPGTVTNASVQ